MALRVCFGLALLTLQAVAHASTKRSPPKGVPLTILPIGDSITVGVNDHTSTGSQPDGLNNGYRLPLYNMLTGAGIDVKMIGSKVDGTSDNPQPHNEGFGGYVINAILDQMKTDRVMQQGPNLVLIHAGTNDNWIPPIDGGADRLATLIDYVLCADPSAVVLVAELVANKYNQTSTDIFNRQIPGIVGDRYMKGYRIRVVDMTIVSGFLIGDLLHPTLAGYRVMAQQWYDAIMNIPDEWWPLTQGISGSLGGTGTIDTCDRNSVSFTPLIGGNQLLQGFPGLDNTAEPISPPETSGMQFSPGWQDRGIVAIGSGDPGSGVIITDLNGDGKADYIWANYTKGSEGAILAWLGDGGTGWSPINNGQYISFGLPGTTYVQFADLDGDHLPEMIYIAGGKFRIYQNRGQSGNIWAWNELTNANDELNYIFQNSAPFHWFADFTGDKLADFMVEGDNGVLDLYINQGSDGNGGFKWRQCKAVGIATDKPYWADLDGDGKADYIAVDSDGGAIGWINTYSGDCSLGWKAINGRTPKSLALGTGLGSGPVRFADMTGNGKADYIDVDNNSGGLHLYENVGSMQPPDSAAIGGFAAAVRLADMDGDGVDDYVSVQATTGIAVTLNGGQDGNSWKWSPQADAHVIALGFSGGVRHGVHLADMNGDGRADYVYVDDDTGALHCYLNNGPSTTGGAWNWNIMGEIAFGVGGVGKGVRLADFDGDGRADYIYLDVNGAARVWRNGGHGDELTNWGPLGSGVAALGVGAYREDVQFADIDGDGKADYIWVHPDTGDTQVWYNGWDGTTFGWSAVDTILPGQGFKSQAVRFGRIGTSGRYDLAVLTEESGAMQAWSNNCGNVIGKAKRPVPGSCGNPPGPTRTTTEPAPTHTSFSESMPCTYSNNNGLMVVYASGTSPSCAGPSRTVFNGKHLSIKVEATASAQVNSVIGEKLYTSVSNSIVAACPSPTGGSTVSSCNAPSAVPRIAYAATDIGGGVTSIQHDGSLEISLPYVRYSTMDTLIGLASAIAGVLNVSSLAPQNNVHQQNCVSANHNSKCNPIDITTIPAIVEAIFTNQDFSTNGNVMIENIEARFKLSEPEQASEYGCTAAGLTSDALGAFGSLYGLEKLGIDKVAAAAGPVIGLTCLIIDAKAQANQASSDPGPHYGDIAYPAEPSLPNPTFTEWPFTATGGVGSGTTLYKSSVVPSVTNGHTTWPTDRTSLLLQAGSTLKVEAATSSSVGVGTLFGPVLSSSIYSALSAACPKPSGTTVTACAPPSSIPSILYKEKPNDPDHVGFNTDASLEVVIPVVQYSTEQGWNGLINTLAGVFNTSSLTPGNSMPYSGRCVVDHIDKGACSGTQYNVGDSAQVIYGLQDDSTNGTLVLELMQVKLVIEKPGHPNPLICSSIGFAAGLFGLFAAFPGLEWLAIIGPVADIVCADQSLTGD